MDLLESYACEGKAFTKYEGALIGLLVVTILAEAILLYITVRFIFRFK